MNNLIRLIYEMLTNIKNCPKGKCTACSGSVDVSFDALNQIEEALEKLRMENAELSMMEESAQDYAVKMKEKVETLEKQKELAADIAMKIAIEYNDNIRETKRLKELLKESVIALRGMGRYNPLSDTIEKELGCEL